MNESIENLKRILGRLEDIYSDSLSNQLKREDAFDNYTFFVTLDDQDGRREHFIKSLHDFILQQICDGHGIQFFVKCLSGFLPTQPNHAIVTL